MMRLTTIARWTAAAVLGVAISHAGISYFTGDGLLVLAAVCMVYVVHGFDAVHLARREYLRGVIHGIHVSKVSEDINNLTVRK